MPLFEEQMGLKYLEGVERKRLCNEKLSRKEEREKTEDKVEVNKKS